MREGQQVIVVGLGKSGINLGTPASDAVAGKWDVVVLEVEVS